MMLQFHSEVERRVSLTSAEQAAVLAAVPDAESITNAVYFDNYNLPCPIRIELNTTRGTTASVVLRKTRHGDVRHEVRLFWALRECGLPVPTVLGAPFENEQGDLAAIYSLLPGENLQKLSMSSPAGKQQAKALLIEAVLRLASVSDQILAHDVAAQLERRSLRDEIRLVETTASEWHRESVFSRALDRVNGQVQATFSPLVLTNGDYQPGNFLAQDGGLTGFLDFEIAGFADPLIGFAKYPIYDLRPLSRTDLVEQFLRLGDFQHTDFQLRVAINCLQILLKEIPVGGGDDALDAYRQRVLRLLKEAV